jgi:hypothetical protein
LATRSTLVENDFDWQRLSRAENYREFLKIYLEVRSRKRSDLARSAGVGRGFPGDVISKKRRLTPKSYYAFEKALKVPSQGRKLFRLLVAREEADVLPALDRGQIETEIDIIRKKSWLPARRNVGSRENSNSQNVFKDHATILVYAASGQPEQGATLEEIKLRTGLDDEKIKKALKNLSETGLVQMDQQAAKYIPRDLHLFFKTDDAGRLLVEFFQRACMAAAKRIPVAVESEQELFFSSTFCISKANLPKLKIALRETVLRFVDDAIQPDGDSLVNFLAALYR